MYNFTFTFVAAAAQLELGLFDTVKAVKKELPFLTLRMATELCKAARDSASEGLIKMPVELRLNAEDAADILAREWLGRGNAIMRLERVKKGNGVFYADLTNVPLAQQAATVELQVS